MEWRRVSPEAFKNLQFNPGKSYANGKLIGKVEFDEYPGITEFMSSMPYMSEKNFEDMWVVWLSEDKSEGIFVQNKVLMEHGISAFDDNYHVRCPYEYLDQLQPNEYIRKVFEVE